MATSEVFASGELAGKVAIVTGGASGIGRATAELFVAEGARVVIADRDRERGEALAATLGAEARFLCTDVGDPTAVQALVDHAVERFGRLDVMFNNAAISNRLIPDLLDDDFADFHAVMSINLLGVMTGTQFAARHMARHGGGSIINTGSIGGKSAGHGVASYRASKAAVIHFSKCAAIALASYNVRVNVINPGHVRTTMSSWKASGMGEASYRDFQRELDDLNLSDQPLKRLGRPEDVAQVALFLASDRSVQMTGTEMTVDGGTTAGDCVNHVAQILDAQTRALGQ